jgi:alginate O-acetyltransferase complex protein AlgJ
MSIMNKSIQYIISVVFILLLVFPLLAKLINLFPDKAQDENRKLTEKPVLDWRHLDKYPSQFDAYFNDHFELRNVGLTLYNQFNVFFLKKSPAPEKAILGKEDWLFEGTYMDIYRGLKKLNSKELIFFKNEFKRRYDFLKQHSCRLLLVVIPTKNDIYSEYLPNGFYKYTKKTLTDQVIDMLHKETEVEIIDLRPVLLKAKSNLNLYHKSDHHWNDIGSYYAYYEIINYLNKTIPVGKPHEFNDYEIKSKKWDSGNLIKMLGMEGKITDTRYFMEPKFNLKAKQLPEKYKSPDRFPYPWAYERRFTVDNDKLPRVMMVNDSFGEYIYPFLAEHFSYSLFLFDSWEYNLHPTIVIDEKPDIFIISIFEPFILNILTESHREENVIPN